MVNEKIVRYVRLMLKKKHSISEIKRGLLNQKLPLRQINAAISFVDQNPLEGRSSSFFKRNKPLNSSPKQPVVKIPQKKKVTNSMLKYKKDKLKYNTKVFLGVVFVVIFVVIFLFILMNVSKPKSSISISEFSLSEGVFLNLSKKSKVNFALDTQEHKMFVSSIKKDSICFQIDTDERCFIKGKVEIIDLNEDNKKDLIVRLDKVEDKLGFLFFKKYGDSVCYENWNCTDFGICINGVKKRLCVDSNSCGTILNKPAIQEICFESSNQTYYYEIPSNLDLKDCGLENETFVNQCFLDAAETCDFAELKASYSIEINPILAIFGMNVSSNISSQMEIRGFSEDGNCTFYEKVFEFSSALHPDYFNYLLESGDYTLEEILIMEAEINDSMQDSVGIWNECSYNHDGLIAMLNSYYNYGPLAEANCVYEVKGDYTYVTCVYGSVELNGVCTSGFN